MEARNEEDGGEVRFPNEGLRSSLLPKGGAAGLRDKASSWTGPWLRRCRRDQSRSSTGQSDRVAPEARPDSDAPRLWSSSDSEGAARGN